VLSVKEILSVNKIFLFLGESFSRKIDFLSYFLLLFLALSHSLPLFALRPRARYILRASQTGALISVENSPPDSVPANWERNHWIKCRKEMKIIGNVKISI